jgi:hypothetical protein
VQKQEQEQIQGSLHCASQKQGGDASVEMTELGVEGEEQHKAPALTGALVFV